MSRRALLISQGEIGLQPRLLKTGDCLRGLGYTIEVIAVRSGAISDALEQAARSCRDWTITETDLRKQTGSGWLRWAWYAFCQRLARPLSPAWTPAWLHCMGGARGIWNIAPARRDVDLVYTNLMDTLPVAVRHARRNGACLLFDSQELFSLQDAGAASDQRWTGASEARLLPHCELVITTTKALGKALQAMYPDADIAWQRVRNLPSTHLPRPEQPPQSPADGHWQLLWQGAHVALSGRGVDLALAALAGLPQNYSLHLQGWCSDANRDEILARAAALDCADRVVVCGPVDPAAVVAAHAGFHVALSCETAADGNTQVTSSNKLFNALRAGVPCVAPDIPGIAESAMDCTGVYLYAFRDAADLAQQVLALTRDHTRYQQAASAIYQAAQTLNWEADFRKLPLERQNSGTR